LGDTTGEWAVSIGVTTGLSNANTKVIDDVEPDLLVSSNHIETAGVADPLITPKNVTTTIGVTRCTQINRETEVVRFSVVGCVHQVRVIKIAGEGHRVGTRISTKD
jgi:hypothetical protein